MCFKFINKEFSGQVLHKKEKLLSNVQETRLALEVGGAKYAN